MKLKISGGKYKRTQICIPEDSCVFRPTKSIVRQAVCNVLQDKIQDAQTLELCAGSCVFSMEMISRGAKKAFAVEQNPKLCKLVKEQTNKYVWNKQIEILCENAEIFVNKTDEKFDIVFFDPPYYTNELIKIAENLQNICRENALLVFEFASGDEFTKDFIPKNYNNYNLRKYGKTSVAFVKGG
jgi:16S rRNA (guanine(966)-N(2))-methyltransferase RsmD